MLNHDALISRIRTLQEDYERKGFQMRGPGLRMIGEAMGVSASTLSRLQHHKALSSDSLLSILVWLTHYTGESWDSLMKDITKPKQRKHKRTA